MKQVCCCGFKTLKTKLIELGAKKVLIHLDELQIDVELSDDPELKSKILFLLNQKQLNYEILE